MTDCAGPPHPGDGHDGAHRLVCRNRRLNDVLCTLLCFWPLFVGLEGTRKFHFTHHRHVGDPGDPEMHFYGRWPSRYGVPIAAGRPPRQFFKDLVGGGVDEAIGFLLFLRAVTVWDRLPSTPPLRPFP